MRYAEDLRLEQTRHEEREIFVYERYYIRLEWSGRVGSQVTGAQFSAYPITAVQFELCNGLLYLDTYQSHALKWDLLAVSPLCANLSGKYISDF